MVEAIEFVCAGKVWVLQTGYSSFVSGAVAYREQYDANDFRRDLPIEHARNWVGRIATITRPRICTCQARIWLRSTVVGARERHT
ncbi:hypothetical protein EN35_27855 [Rhodococcus qingshengii]|nr:hypothetical protein EN35_27855 [Rhodococcus qingshengii]